MTERYRVFGRKGSSTRPAITVTISVPRGAKLSNQARAALIDMARAATAQFDREADRDNEAIPDEAAS